MSRVLCETKFLQLKDEDGWFYTHRPNVSGIVIIVPVIRGEEVMFLKTRRPPLMAEGISKFNIELPAGLVGDTDKSESILDCAGKELLEETGLRAARLKILTHNLTSSGGLTSETSSVVLAVIEDDTPAQIPQNDGGIILERVRVGIADIPEWLLGQEQEGGSIGAQTLAGLYLFLCHNESVSRCDGGGRDERSTTSTT